MNVSQMDVEWVHKSYPLLSVTRNEESIEIHGPFCFNAAWDEGNRQYIINPNGFQSSAFIQIREAYEIRIIIPQTDGISEVYETGGRIKANAIKWGMRLIDLHMYDDGKICYAGPFDTNEITDLQKLLDGAVLQYFYDQSYFEKYGRWPRGEYSHGLSGAIENMVELLNGEHADYLDAGLKLIFQSDSDEGRYYKAMICKNNCPAGHRLCPCGSKKRIRDCHKALFKGLWQLNRYYNQNKNNIKEA